jgi:octaprenyl-diphosphate synthase
MIRPALVCLSAQASGGPGKKSGRDGSSPEWARLGVAGAVELIHVASLIHDDVIDAADRRRGRASVNALWGNQVAVLLGDYLFSKAFHLLVRLRQDEIAAAVAWATTRMSQAEIQQIKCGNRPHTDEKIYFDIIEGKTAELMSAACRCGALTTAAAEDAAAALSTFGLEWGMAFQITDDALDLTESADSLGKPIGSDIQTGKMTLPIIHALTHAPEADRQRLQEILHRTDGDHQEGMDDVREILGRCGAIEHALDVARLRARRAAAALDSLERSPARESLMALVEFVTGRKR